MNINIHFLSRLYFFVSFCLFFSRHTFFFVAEHADMTDTTDTSIMLVRAACHVDREGPFSPSLTKERLNEYA